LRVAIAKIHRPLPEKDLYFFSFCGAPKVGEATEKKVAFGEEILI
jgi:hypothetical protein